MEKVLNSEIDLCFQTLDLGKLPEHLNGLSGLYMFKIMLIASKKAITKKWLNQVWPTLADWFDVMHNIYTMEKLTFALRLKTDIFELYWEGWTDFIKDYRTDFC